MAQGITIKNSDNDYIMMTSAGGLFFNEKVTYTSSDIINLGTGGTAYWYSKSFTFDIDTLSTQTPSLFIKMVANYYYRAVALTEISTVGGVTSWIYVVNVYKEDQELSVPNSAAPIVYVFTDLTSKTAATSGYGVVTRNSGGEVLYDSTKKPLVISSITEKPVVSTTAHTEILISNGGQVYKLWRNDITSKTFSFSDGNALDNLYSLPLSSRSFAKKATSMYNPTFRVTQYFRNWAIFDEGFGIKTSTSRLYCKWGNTATASYFWLSWNPRPISNPFYDSYGGGTGAVTGSQDAYTEAAVGDVVGDMPTGTTEYLVPSIYSKIVTTKASRYD